MKIDTKMKRDEQTKTIRINPELWDKFRIYCIKNKSSIRSTLEEWISEGMKK